MTALSHTTRKLCNSTRNVISSIAETLVQSMRGIRPAKDFSRRSTHYSLRLYVAKIAQMRSSPKPNIAEVAALHRGSFPLTGSTRRPNSDRPTPIHRVTPPPRRKRLSSHLAGNRRPLQRTGSRIGRQDNKETRVIMLLSITTNTAKSSLRSHPHNSMSTRPIGYRRIPLQAYFVQRDQEMETSSCMIPEATPSWWQRKAGQCAQCFALKGTSIIGWTN